LPNYFRGEYPFRDDDRAAIGDEPPVSSAGRGGNVVDRQVPLPLPAHVQEGLHRRAPIPRGRIVPIHDPEPLGKAGLIVIEIEIIEGDRGNAESAHEGGFTRAGGSGEEHDPPREPPAPFGEVKQYGVGNHDLHYGSLPASP